MKNILYIDCDGVILDTIETAFTMMKENNIDITNKYLVDYFFRNINWNYLINNSMIINNAIEKIKILKNNNIYQDVVILTKLSGNYDEERLKRDTFFKLLPNIKVITLPRDYNKALVVPSINNILIDDEDKNIASWNNYGGIGIKFTKDIIDLDNNIINDLNDIENTSKVKMLRKTSK